MLCIPCLARINPLRLQGNSSDPPTPIQGWAQHRKTRTIVLDVENCSLRAHSRVCYSNPAALVDHSSGNPRRCNSPAAKAQMTSRGSNTAQEVSKVGTSWEERQIYGNPKVHQKMKIPMPPGRTLDPKHQGLYTH